MPPAEEDSGNEDVRNMIDLYVDVAMEILEDFGAEESLRDSLMDLTLLPDGRLRLALHLYLAYKWEFPKIRGVLFAFFWES